MTYSQRLSGGASLSDMLHLEQQIDLVKEERQVASDKLRRYEQEWNKIKSESQEEEAILENEEAEALTKKFVDARTHVNSLTAQLEELETVLDEMVD
ncbi:hypothetical protein [Paenibacillus amylolyticus]|uniref:hypothetical protein n=1 Tax=Paenibacillus amylolyticus TaxID=1451 RepID=UPI003EB7FF2B